MLEKGFVVKGTLETDSICETKYGAVPTSQDNSQSLCLRQSSVV